MLTQRACAVRRLVILGDMPRENDDVGEINTISNVQIAVKDDGSDDELSDYATMANRTTGPLLLSMKEMKHEGDLPISSGASYTC